MRSNGQVLYSQQQQVVYHQLPHHQLQQRVVYQPQQVVLLSAQVGGQVRERQDEELDVVKRAVEKFIKPFEANVDTHSCLRIAATMASAFQSMGQNEVIEIIERSENTDRSMFFGANRGDVVRSNSHSAKVASLKELWTIVWNNTVGIAQDAGKIGLDTVPNILEFGVEKASNFIEEYTEKLNIGKFKGIVKEIGKVALVNLAKNIEGKLSEIRGEDDRKKLEADMSAKVEKIKDGVIDFIQSTVGAELYKVVFEDENGFCGDNQTCTLI